MSGTDPVNAVNAVDSIWASPAAQATAQALMHFLWQGAAVGLAAGLALSLLARAKASTRYAVAVGTLLLMAALPVATALRLAASPELPTVPMAAVVDVVPSGPAERTLANPGARAVAQTFGGSLLPWIFGVWLAGVAALSLYHLGGWRLARRLSRQGRPAGEAVSAMARDLCRRLGIGRVVAFLESPAVSVPTVVGWLRPVVLVPASALTGLSPAQLEAILAHELAHVRRHDYLVNLLQTAVETLLFYHPAVWWVSAQVRRERENCCDDLAVAVCGDRLGYARALVDLEGLRAAPRLALAASGGSLSERVRRLVGAPRRSSRRSWAAGLLALALLPAGAAVQIACHRDTKAEIAGDPTGPQGTWSVEPDGNGLRLEVTMSKRSWGNWIWVDSFGQIPGLVAGPDVRFEWRRDAGTFHFGGRFDGKRGQGAVTFAGNPAFAKVMGWKPSSERLYEFAASDISLDFVQQMRGLGYGRRKEQPAGHSWAAMHDFARDLLGVHRSDPADTLVDLHVQGITPEFVRGVRAAGYPHLGTWQLVELRNHGIEPAYVKGLRESGYQRLLPSRIVEFSTHGITPEWLRGIVEAGYASATPEQIIDLRIHGIDGDFIRKARAQGYGHVTPGELIVLRVHGKVKA